MAEKSVSTESLAVEKKQKYAGKKLRVAIIGCGGISKLHMDALEQMPDVEVVAGVDINKERLAGLQEKYRVPQIYLEWKKMLK